MIMPEDNAIYAQVYIVVENAGYDSECDVRTFNSAAAAWRWMKKHYNHDELDPSHPDCLHVEVCREINGNRTYDF